MNMKPHRLSKKLEKKKMRVRKSKSYKYYPVYTERKLNVHKTFRRRPELLLSVLCTFYLRPVSMGIVPHKKLFSLTAQCNRLPSIRYSNESICDNVYRM